MIDPDLIDMAFEDRISGDCVWDDTIEDRWDGPTWGPDEYEYEYEDEDEDE